MLYWPKRQLMNITLIHTYIRHTLTVAALAVISVQVTFSQTPSQPHAPNNPLPQWVHDNQRKRGEFERRGGSPSMPDLNRAEREGRASARRRRDRQRPMTSEERKRMAELIAPHPEDLETYKDFLDEDRTGIFRIFPNADCVEKNIVRVGGDCENFVPDRNTFRFRPGATTDDIAFNSDRLMAIGFFRQYLLGNIGDVDLRTLAKGDARLKFIEGFTPGTTVESAREQSRQLRQGISADGVTYSFAVEPKLNSSYVFRIIAYRVGNNVQRRIFDSRKDPHHPSRLFATLRRDKQTDMLVVFRIIRKDADGNSTIIWKELDRNDPPEITFGKDQAWEDFK